MFVHGVGPLPGAARLPLSRGEDWGEGLQKDFTAIGVLRDTTIVLAFEAKIENSGAS